MPYLVSISRLSREDAAQVMYKHNIMIWSALIYTLLEIKIITIITKLFYMFVHNAHRISITRYRSHTYPE